MRKKYSDRKPNSYSGEFQTANYLDANNKTRGQPIAFESAGQDLPEFAGQL